MSVLPTRSPDPWKATGGTGPRSGRPRRRIEPADVIEIIHRSLIDAVARKFPDIWEDLSDDGQDMFARGLMEAASRPPEDRVQAVAEVIDSWQTAWSLLYAPVDDEPFTPEEAAAADAALDRVRQGQGVLLDDLDLLDVLTAVSICVLPGRAASTVAFVRIGASRPVESHAPS